MKITSSQKVKLGLFVITTSLILIVALYFIGKKQHLFGKTVQITAVFDNVNGLKLGNNVRYAGINVGTVRNILMINDSTICVDMILQKEILKHMKKNALAVVGSDGLVGSMVINIFPGSSDGPLLVEGDTIGSIKKVTTSDMMSTLSVTNQNASDLSKNLLTITESINQGKGTLGLLLKDQATADDLKETLANLKNASFEATKAIREINDVVASSFDNDESLFNILVKDSLSGQQFKLVMGNLQKSSEHLDSVLVNLNDVVLQVKHGDGLVHELVTDTIIANDIDTTVKNLKKGSVLLNENLEAMRHNFLFRGYFKKQEKQREKQQTK
jgi:phospholipid/cholesterol/gamma-HCH transport system substrate-binding protein